MSLFRKRKKAPNKNNESNSKNVEKEMSFVEHLEELRWHLIRSLIAIIIFGVLAFVFRKFVFDFIGFKNHQFRLILILKNR